MARSVGESDVDQLAPTIPDLIQKGKVPTIDELMRRPPLPDWWKLLPPPARPNPNPFGPVPMIPAPIDVDPPSRPPEWLFGPPYISKVPTRAPSFGGLSTQFAPP